MTESLTRKSVPSGQKTRRAVGGEFEIKHVLRSSPVGVPERKGFADLQDRERPKSDKPGLKVRIRSDHSQMGNATGFTRTTGPSLLVQTETGPGERPRKWAEQPELVPERSETARELLLARKRGGPESLGGELVTGFEGN